MTKEDYAKYYIQGSDHYLIPTDVFIELINEMINWREDSKIQSKENEKLKRSLIDIRKYVNNHKRNLINPITHEEYEELDEENINNILQIIDKVLDLDKVRR
ncbi:hypothetical protein [uncultured Thomasclavelia sp.]|uniref:hypothetical protein n=1 Tax=uncultured Thomasclavelia sp. TaxID=3025759 RepID=UPI00259520C0|nr:hypothetical protein [uncultured Thomasclavelia sp.]